MQQGRKEHRRPAYISGSKTVRGAIMNEGRNLFRFEGPAEASSEDCSLDTGDAFISPFGRPWRQD